MISFRPLTLSDEDIELLHKWLNKPHVQEHWDLSPETLEQTRKKYKKKVNTTSDFSYIVYHDEKPVGYIQSYNASAVGDGWWGDEPLGTWGLDMYIGEENELGKGLGSKITKQFAEKLFEEEKAKRVIVDPKPTNLRAIRSYEKAGFKKVGEIDTPDGKALLMEIKCD
jgi:RimJ/RimL family protein N-acetyltransferase